MRARLHAFNARGLDALGMRPDSGRKPRLTEAERGAVLALTGELTAPDPQAEPVWKLDALTAAARIATARRNRHAQPWLWSRPPPPHCHLGRCFVYRL